MHFARASRVSNLARCGAFFAGILVVLSATLAGQVTYETDPATGRLMKATFAGGSYVTYSYDANGNRTDAVLTLVQDTTPPSAPSGLSASAVSPTQISVSWNASTDNVGVTEYRLERCQGSVCSNFAEIAQPTGTTHSDISASAATTYRYRVRATDAATNLSGYSNIASVTTPDVPDVTAPSAPGIPSFSSITETSATASWGAASDNVGVTGYQYSLNGGAWTAGSSPQSLSGLSPRTTYSFQVRARDAAGNWGPPSSNSFTTPDNTAPSAPGIPTFSSITGSSATASWTAATDNVAVTGYRYRLNGGAWIADNASPASLTGLSQATTYSFQVSARDAAGNWGAASTASFTTLDVSAPSAPGTPSFTSITHNSATASWSAASDNVGVTGYQYRLNGGSWIANSSTSVNLTGLSANTSYSFQVRARDAAGNFGNASSGSFTTFAQITISNRTVSTKCGPHACTAVYVLTSGGDILATQATVSTTTDVGDWLAPKVGMSGFQARATGNCTGSNNTWVGFSTQWTKTVSGSSGTTAQCSFVLEFRRSANPTAILGTATIVLRATVQ